MRRRLTVLLAMAVLLAMMVANAGMASAAPGKNGRGAENANSNASFGITMAIVNSGGDECGACNPV